MSGTTVSAMSDDPVVLRPVLEDDLSVLEQFLMDPGLTGEFQWQGWSDPGRWRRRWSENGLLGDDGGQLMVVAGADRLGFVAWRKVVTWRTSYCWSIGIQLLPEARGRGVGTLAQRLLVQYLFAHTPVVRIEADTETSNVAERRALEKSGFTSEGILRSVVFRDGRWRDNVHYSVLRDDVASAGDMDARTVTLRKMTPEEYDAATGHREAESVRALSEFMPEELARERVRQGTARFLPDGLDTAGHHLVVAQNGSGEVVGNAWIGPDPGRSSGTTSSAWLYDINVFAPFRRRGYGSAILAAAEELVAREGRTALGLNVVGSNEPAIAMYRRSGYEVSSMSMRKNV